MSPVPEQRGLFGTESEDWMGVYERVVGRRPLTPLSERVAS